MNKAEMIKEIKRIGMYDFVCNNYHLLSKEYLKDIITEQVMVATDSDYIREAIYNDKINDIFNDRVIESLEEDRDWNEE